MASQNFIDPSACLQKGNEDVEQRVSDQAGMCPDRYWGRKGMKKKAEREKGCAASMVDITIELKLPNVIHLPIKQTGRALY